MEDQSGLRSEFTHASFYLRFSFSVDKALKSMFLMAEFV
jgi:hypothetical protein